MQMKDEHISMETTLIDKHFEIFCVIIYSCDKDYGMVASNIRQSG